MACAGAGLPGATGVRDGWRATTRVRYNVRASVIVYTGEHPVANALAWLWIRLIAVLTYVS
jgi:hypothetical protein